MSHVRRYEYGVYDLFEDVSIPIIGLVATAETYCKEKTNVRDQLDLALGRAAE